MREPNAWLRLTPFLALLWSAAAAEAAPTSFIASAGSDTGPCTRTQPCRTLQRGIDVTTAGGQLVILDSGSYGSAATIIQSITIVADGVSATLGNPGGIAIDAPGAVVSLRGLHLNGGESNIHGIDIEEAAAVHVENCVVERFDAGGIRVATGFSGELFILDTIVRDNALGNLSVSAAANTTLTIDNSRFENSSLGDGMDIQGARSTITRTVTAGNRVDGITLSGGTTSVAATISESNGEDGFDVFNGEISLESSVARGNGTIGLEVRSGSTARVSGSTITDNATGISNSASTVETRQNNTVRGNVTDIVGVVTAISGT